MLWRRRIEIVDFLAHPGDAELLALKHCRIISMKNINRVKKIIKNQTTKIFFICLVLPAILNFFPIIKRFPDYYAYETMFYNWEELPNINWGPLYILLNQAFRYLGLDYNTFRTFLY